MNKKALYLLIGLSFGTVSCSDNFLSLAPETQLNAVNFYKTETDFQQALTGVYQALRNHAGTSGWIMGEMRSDNTHYDYYAKDRGVTNLYREAVSNFLDDAQNTQTSPKYTGDFLGISRANNILDRIGSAAIPETVKNQITGEAKLLRAFFYFDLVQFYGGVPLHLSAVTNEEGAFFPRSTTDQVYTALVADAQDAIQRLAVPTFPQTGRATLGTAKMLLAKVYMVQKKYPEAETLLKDITKMGYSLQSDYAAIFDTKNKNNAESIFEVQYQQGNQSQQSSYIYSFIPRMGNTTVITGVNSNNLTLGGWNIPSQDLMEAYETGDKRLDASVGIAEGVLDSGGDFVPQAVKSVVDYRVPTGKTARRFVKKYLHAHSLPLNTDDNWPIYRYADALLLLAESLNEQNKPGEALPYLNQVRSRAGLPASTASAQATLRDAIAKERRVELAFENQRWLDLLRTGKAVSVMTAFGTRIKQEDSSVPANAYQITAERLLFPIPFTEIQRNTLLVQNQGY
ncbi:RagB/SusD family nutrient uptake outer membrane protein [Spirosoma humi]